MRSKRGLAAGRVDGAHVPTGPPAVRGVSVVRAEDTPGVSMLSKTLAGATATPPRPKKDLRRTSLCYLAEYALRCDWTAASRKGARRS